MKDIHKKILPEYFEAVASGDKTFEIGKDANDVQAGDRLHLYECMGGEYTGKVITRIVNYVLRSDEEQGLRDGYAVYGIVPPGVYKNRAPEAKC